MEPKRLESDTMSAAKTIVLKFTSARKKNSIYNQLYNAPTFREYLDGHDDKTIFMKFPTEEFRKEIMDTLKQRVPRFRIISRNGQEQMKIYSR